MKAFPVFYSQPGKSRRLNSGRSFRTMGAFLAALMWAMFLVGGLSIPVYGADTPPYELYLYNAQGVPIDVTASYYCQNSYVYSDATGDVVGIALYQKGHIYDLSGNDIGLIVTND
jgi:hypothetical protein